MRVAIRAMPSAEAPKIGILMMFLPHLILANHFNEKAGLCA